MPKAQFISKSISISALLLGCASNDATDDPAATANGPRSLAANLPLGASGPEYSATGELVRPDDWPEWVFLGATLNLSYTDEPVPADLFSNVFMEPSAYAAYQQTGTFPEGTQTALIVYVAATGAEPVRGGEFAGDAVAFEMSVKDSSLDPSAPWRYYSFAGDAPSAAANPPETCFACHTEHAATDHVFTQFYPVLRDGPR